MPMNNEKARCDNKVAKEPSFAVDIHIADPEWEILPFNVREVAEICVRETLFCTQFSSEQGAEVSLLLGHNDLAQTLNREYRDQDKPTNVLSFQSEDPGPEMPLGDIILARETIIHEAETQLIPIQEHFMHLIVHGTLHLLGYHHEEEQEAEDMEAMEIWILQRLGVKNPYLTEDNL